MRVLRGDGEQALEPLEQALRLAEKLRLDEVFVQALTSKAVQLIHQGRFEEARVLLDAALERADVKELHGAWFRASINLGVLLQDSDSYVQLIELTDEAEAKARQLGDREQLAGTRFGTVSALFLLGRWAEALALRRRSSSYRQATGRGWSWPSWVNQVRAGQACRRRARLRRIPMGRRRGAGDDKGMFKAVEARLCASRKLDAEALAAAEQGLALLPDLGVASSSVKRNLAEALEAALALGDTAKAEELLALAEGLHPGEVTPLLAAQRARFRARLDVEHGRHDRVDESFSSAAAIFREFGLAFHLAVTQLEHAEWLGAQSRTDEAEPLLAEAGETFERLEANPWLERLAAARDPHAECGYGLAPETAQGWAVKDSSLRPWGQEKRRVGAAGFGGSGFKRVFEPIRSSISAGFGGLCCPPVAPRRGRVVAKPRLDLVRVQPSGSVASAVNGQPRRFSGHPRCARRSRAPQQASPPQSLVIARTPAFTEALRPRAQGSRRRFVVSSKGGATAFTSK